MLRWKLLGVFCKVNGELTRRIFHKVHYLPQVSHPTPNLHTMLIEKKKSGDIKSERPESMSKGKYKQEEKREDIKWKSIEENEGQ